MGGTVTSFDRARQYARRVDRACSVVEHRRVGCRCVVALAPLVVGSAAVLLGMPARASSESPAHRTQEGAEAWAAPALVAEGVRANDVSVRYGTAGGPVAAWTPATRPRPVWARRPMDGTWTSPRRLPGTW